MTSYRSSCAIASGSSAFGTMIRPYAVCASASRSSAWSGVPIAFTRTITASGSTGLSINACRAAALSAGATASSRSKIAKSAASSAFWYRSGRDAGQNRYAGPDSGAIGFIVASSSTARSASPRTTSSPCWL